MARAQLIYLTNPITQPKGKEYVQDLCKDVYRICEFLPQCLKCILIWSLSHRQESGVPGGVEAVSHQEKF